MSMLEEFSLSSQGQETRAACNCQRSQAPDLKSVQVNRALSTGARKYSVQENIPSLGLI